MSILKSLPRVGKIVALKNINRTLLKNSKIQENLYIKNHAKFKLYPSVCLGIRE